MITGVETVTPHPGATRQYLKIYQDGSKSRISASEYRRLLCQLANRLVKKVH